MTVRPCVLPPITHGYLDVKITAPRYAAICVTLFVTRPVTLGLMTCCWAPECANALPPIAPNGRESRYCSAACKQRAFRRNGRKAPSKPYPPHPDAPEVASVPAAVVPSKPPEGRAAAHAETTADPVPEPVHAEPTPEPSESAPVGEAPGLALPGEVGAGDSGPPGAPSDPHEPTVPVRVHPLVKKYVEELTVLGQADSLTGLQVIDVVTKLVSSATSPAAGASLSKEATRLMDELKAVSPQALAQKDPSLIIRERTLAKLRAVSAA